MGTILPIPTKNRITYETQNEDDQASMNRATPNMKMQVSKIQFLRRKFPRDAMTNVPDKEPIPAPVIKSPA